MQNSTAVFQLNISNNINFCASKSRPNAKPRTVINNSLAARIQLKQKLLSYFLFCNSRILKRRTFVELETSLVVENIAETYLNISVFKCTKHHEICATENEFYKISLTLKNCVGQMRFVLQKVLYNAEKPS